MTRLREIYASINNSVIGSFYSVPPRTKKMSYFRFGKSSFLSLSLSLPSLRDCSPRISQSLRKRPIFLFRVSVIHRLDSNSLIPRGAREFFTLEERAEVVKSPWPFLLLSVFRVPPNFRRKFAKPEHSRRPFAKRSDPAKSDRIYVWPLFAKKL